MKTITIIGLLLLTPLIGFAYAEEFTVELSTEDGFTPQYLNATHGDKVTFIIRDGEAHDVSNPWYGGHNFLNHDNPSITHTFDTCNTYKFDSTFYIDEIFTLDVVNCPVPEPVVSIPQNTTVTPPVVFIETDPHENGFTGWKNEGTEMVAYKDGIRVASYEIFGANTQVPESRGNPFDSVTDDIEDTADTTILKLRIEIMKLLKGILELLVRV